MLQYSSLTRSQFYRHALVNLGVGNTVRRAISRKFGGDPMRLGSRHLDHPVSVRRDTSDLYTFDTIFVEREYKCLDDLSEVKTVLDAGANCGYSSAYFLSRFPECRVISIEPDLANYELVLENLAPYGERATTILGAVWSHETTLRFEADSLGQNNEWGRRTEEGDGAVEAHSMAGLIRDYRIDRIDILKVDIEGAERAVFGAQETGWLDKVSNIVIEPHGPDCVAAIEKAMKPYRFERSTSGELMVFKSIRQCA